MKTYHVYKLKQEKKQKLRNFLNDNNEIKIYRIGLNDYVYDKENDEFIPFEEMFSLERRTK